MTQAISSTNASTFAGELAALLIEADTTRTQSDQLQRQGARAEFLENAQRQVDALHAAADATATGALLNGAFAVASGACSIGATFSQYGADLGKAEGAPGCVVAGDQFDANTENATAKLLGSLGELGKGIFGDSAAQNHQADAKHFETLAAQSQWQASDASSDADKAAKHSDQVLEILQSIQSNQNQSNNAIIGRI